MKLDSEQLFAHSTLGHKPSSKSLEHHDNSLDSTEMRSEKSIIKEYQNGALCASKANEGIADHLPYVTNDVDGWTATKHDRSLSLNDLSHGNGKNVSDGEKPYFLSCQKKESFEDSVFYMDKSVTESELPELIVCYKENSYCVKDICVDEGVPSQGRILFETDVDEKGASTFLPPKEHRNNELMEGKKNAVMPLSDVLKSSAENVSDNNIAHPCDSSLESDSDEDIVDLCDSNNLMASGEGKDHETDKMENDVPKNFFSLRDLLSMQALRTKNSNSKSSNNNDIETEKQSFQGSSEEAALADRALFSNTKESDGEIGEATLVSSDVVSAAEESKNGKAVLGGPALISTAEESNRGVEEATLVSSDLVSAGEESITEKAALADPAFNSTTKDSNGRTEEETVVSSDINLALVFATQEIVNDSKEAILGSSDVVSSSRESTKSSIVNNLLYNSKVETGSIAFNFDASAAAAARGREERLQNSDSGSAEAPQTSRLENNLCQSISSRVHSSLGESSFSVTDSSPALISYSGPIAYSGSLSLRSDSSTTSTRSFAFPILQSEWNSSPVRMAKADRRHYRKQKCWRQGLLCCRF